MSVSKAVLLSTTALLLGGSLIAGPQALAGEGKAVAAQSRAHWSRCCEQDFDLWRNVDLGRRGTYGDATIEWNRRDYEVSVNGAATGHGAYKADINIRYQYRYNGRGRWHTTERTLISNVNSDGRRKKVFSVSGVDVRKLTVQICAHRPGYGTCGPWQ
jgi:hypothetical protein